MSETSRRSALALFRVRSFRFQWPADLATSWAFEMETVILGWYVLVETKSVLMLTIFAALQYMGSLTAPIFGVLGDRVGPGKVLCAMRAIYALLAVSLMALAFSGALTPVYVLIIAGLTGLLHSSDMALRITLIGGNIPPALLMSGMSISRTTQDSSRIAGALMGATLVASLGMGPAYIIIAVFYAISFTLTLKVARMRPPRDAALPAEAARASAWRELKAGLAYVWETPHLLATMCLGFLVNLTAFPLVLGLMPYVAKEIYRTDQTGLGYMVAALNFGALAGSIVLSRLGGAMRPARLMIVGAALWYLLLMVFGQLQHAVVGIFVLMLIGAAQGMSQVPQMAMLLRNSEPQFRGRVMGIRMLGIYGLPVGLLIAGPLISQFGYPVTASIYSLSGLALTVLIAVRWRTFLWRRDAPANLR